MFILSDFPLALFSRRVIEGVTYHLDLVRALDVAHPSYISAVHSSERLLELHTNCALWILNYTLCFMLHALLTREMSENEFPILSLPLPGLFT